MSGVYTRLCQYVARHDSYPKPEMMRPFGVYFASVSNTTTSRLWPPFTATALYREPQYGSPTYAPKSAAYSAYPKTAEASEIQYVNRDRRLLAECLLIAWI